MWSCSPNSSWLACVGDQPCVAYILIVLTAKLEKKKKNKQTWQWRGEGFIPAQAEFFSTVVHQFGEYGLLVTWQGVIHYGKQVCDKFCSKMCCGSPLSAFTAPAGLVCKLKETYVHETFLLVKSLSNLPRLPVSDPHSAPTGSLWTPANYNNLTAGWCSEVAGHMAHWCVNKSQHSPNQPGQVELSPSMQFIKKKVILNPLIPFRKYLFQTCVRSTADTSSIGLVSGNKIQNMPEIRHLTTSCH